MRPRFCTVIVITFGVIFCGGCNIRPAAKTPAPKATPAAKRSEPTPPAPVKAGAHAKGKSVLDGLREEDLLGQKPLTQKEFNKIAEEVVAIVGGKKIKKKNVWEAFCVPRDNDQVPPFNQQLLNQAIENELVYKEGLRRGVDKTEEFKSRLKEEQLNQWKNQVPRLAGLIQEKKLSEFSRTMPPSTPSPEKVEELFAKCRAYFPRETASDEQVRTTLRTLLSRQAPYTAYQKWLADLFDSAKVRVNGKPLALAKVSQSLRDFSLVEGLKGVKAGQREAQMLYDTIRRELPGDTDVTTLKIEINDDSINVGEQPELQGILQQAKAAHKEKLAAPTQEEAKDFALKLFTVVKNHLLAQQAKKEGISMAAEGPLWETPIEKRVITSMLIGKIVSEESPVELTKEEVIAFYRTHPMYQGMDIETAKKRIYERLSGEKTREAAINRLKKQFGVKILTTEL